MTESTQQAIQTPVTQTQEPAMPTGNQQTAEVPTVEGAAEVQTQVTPQPEVQSELPEEVSERTRTQFEKLTTQLRTEREKREQLESTFARMQPAQTVKPIYDPITGILNESVFTDTQKQAYEARQKADTLEKELIALREERQQSVVDQERNTAYTAHPQLDPQDKKSFNKDFLVEARRIKIDSMLNPQDYGGKQLSLKEAGDKAKQSLSQQLTKATEEAKKQGAEEAITNLTPKEQASLEAQGSPARQVDVAGDQESLVKQTRQGGERGIQAIMQRMQNLKAKG